MTIDPGLWDCASGNIVRSIEELHKELGTSTDCRNQVDTYTEACQSMAIHRMVKHGGSELRGMEALEYWNDLHTNLRNSLARPKASPPALPNYLIHNTCTSRNSHRVS